MSSISELNKREKTEKLEEEVVKLREENAELRNAVIGVSVFFVAFSRLQIV